MIIEDKKIIYLHTRKCGGSSIIKSFGNDVTDWDRYNCGTLSKGIMPDGKCYGDWHDSLMDDFFIFTSVRNPWDKMVSAYFYSGKGMQIHGRVMGFKEFINNLPRKEDNFTWWIHATANLSDYLYTESGHLAAHKVLRFEKLTEDYNNLMSELDYSYKLPHVNKSNRPKGYKDIYTEETKGMVAKIFEKDIDNFKYTF